MNQSRPKPKRRYERYELYRSPLAQKPTQRDLAQLVGLSRDDLRRLANYKEQFIVRREIKKGDKVRQLAYPEGLLRVVHEKLKFHLNKVRQPDYLFSPRKNRGQRDNAKLHLDQQQYLTLDLKQFYPSTTQSQVRNWLIRDLGMMEDVAGLFAEIACVDDVVSFGSPLTPVLCTLVHRNMFDKIASLCGDRRLRCSLWVDDLTISGQYVPGELVEQIRLIIQSYGHRSHKIKYLTGNRPVFITGIGVVGSNLVAPQTLHLRIKEYWEQLHAAETDDEKLNVYQLLLSQLGTQRHIAGPSSELGRKASDQMNSIRQKRDKLIRQQPNEAALKTVGAEFEETHDPSALPW
jgi:RNA-directed DNA polymerase